MVTQAGRVTVGPTSIRAAVEQAAAGITGPIGDVYFVDPTNGNNANAGKTPETALSTLDEAYSRAQSNHGDVIALNSYATHTLTAGIAWTKSRITVVSLDFRGRVVQQGAKVQSPSSDTTAYVVKVTGVRNSFVGIKFIQASTNAAALTVVQDGGEGTLYDHCSFVFGVVDNLDQATAYEFLAGSDSATFVDCLFGTETLLTSAARSVFRIDQVTASQEFKSNILRDCVFMISSSEGTATLISVAANTDVLFTNLFDNCRFMASLDSAGGAALTNAVASVSGLVKGTLNFAFPAAFGVTNFCAGTTDQVQTYGPATSAQAGEAGTPA